MANIAQCSIEIVGNCMARTISCSNRLIAIWRYNRLYIARFSQFSLSFPVFDLFDYYLEIIFRD